MKNLLMDKLLYVLIIIYHQYKFIYFQHMNVNYFNQYKRKYLYRRFLLDYMLVMKYI